MVRVDEQNTGIMITSQPGPKVECEGSLTPNPPKG